jgi:hypothetical protein
LSPRQNVNRKRIALTIHKGKRSFLSYIAKKENEVLLLPELKYRRAGGTMRKLLLILFLGIVLVSCGKKETVKHESADSLLSQEAFTLAETVRTAFIDKDIATLKKNSLDEGYKALSANKKVYDRVELTFTPRWVEIDKAKVFLNIAWKSKWTTSDRIADDRGMAVFVLEGKPLKLSKILRANPFVHP